MESKSRGKRAHDPKPFLAWLNNGSELPNIYYWLACMMMAIILSSTANANLTPPSVDDEIGYSVSVSEDTAIVGAYYDDEGGFASGAAFVYSRNQNGPDHWGQVIKLTADDATAGAQFGISVAIDGDTAIVGASGDGDHGPNTGSAYVFVRHESDPNQWQQVAKLNAHDGAAYDFFGSTVAIDDDVAIIGAPQDDDGGSSSGSAYIYSRHFGGADQWGQVTKITSSDASAVDFFGWSVAIDGDLAVVSAIHDDDAGPDSGAAYVFSRNEGGGDSWGQVAKLTANDGDQTDFFGSSVAVAGDTAIVGALWHDSDGLMGSGAAYIFSRDQGGLDSWGQVTKLVADDATAQDFFGFSVALDADTAVVGALGDDDDGKSSGAAYIFGREPGGAGQWEQIAKLNASDGGTEHFFGRSVAIDGDVAVIGAYNLDLRSGSAHVFSRDLGGSDHWGELVELATVDDADNDFLGLPVKLKASDAETSDQFASSVSVDADTSLVGAVEGGNGAGAAYVYSRNAGGPDHWGETTKLLASDADADDFFGWSVSLSQDTAIIGAYGDDEFGSDSGSAYVYLRDMGGPGHWGLAAKLTAFNAAPGDRFGWSVAVDENTSVVGAFWADIDSEENGSAYIFSRDVGGPGHWGHIATLTAPDTLETAWFGYSVSIDGPYAIIGAVAIDDFRGSAFVFSQDMGGLDNWGLVTELSANDVVAGDLFGRSVSIHGETVVVGSNANNERAGSAYVFTRSHGGVDNWGKVAKLTADDGTINVGFGLSVAIDGDFAMIGAPSDDEGGTERGSVYLYSRHSDGRNGWGQVANFRAYDGRSFDRFGSAVSLAGNTAIVGAPWDDDGIYNSGSAYALVGVDVIFKAEFETLSGPR